MDYANDIDYQFEIINRRFNELNFLLGELKNMFFLISYKLNKLNKENPEKKNIDINISNLIVTNKNFKNHNLNNNINKTKKLDIRSNKEFNLSINSEFEIKINKKKTRKKPRKRIVRSVFVIDTSDESNSD